ncbi:hypothetical protein ACLBWX_04165 [Methylobacterium sp. M6A4_1b]
MMMVMPVPATVMIPAVMAVTPSLMAAAVAIVVIVMMVPVMAPFAMATPVLDRCDGALLIAKHGRRQGRGLRRSCGCGEASGQGHSNEQGFQSPGGTGA